MKKVGFGLLILVAFWLIDQGLSKWVNPYFLIVLSLIGINIILTVSLNLINGFTGQFSLGHAGFMAVGAYTAAIFTLGPGQRFEEWFSGSGLSHLLPGVCVGEVAFLVALLLGGFVAALTGALVGLPTLRLRGDYLAIATLGFSQIVVTLFYNTPKLGGALGLNGIPYKTTLTWSAVWVLITILVIRNLVQSSYGRTLLAIREDEMAAEASGIDTTRGKILAFVVGAFFAGMAGALFAHRLGRIDPDTFNFLRSFDIVVMVVLGGSGSITGSVLAAIVLTALRELLRAFDIYRLVLYSLLLIVLMLTRPQGILGNHELSLKKYFRWPRSLF